jgi:hypothetical protein
VRLAVGIPWQSEMMWSHFLFNLWETDIPKTAKLIRGKRMDVPQSRNQIVRDAMSWGAEKLLFLDVDQSSPPDVLARLSSHKKDIVSGWAPLRKHPHFPLVYEKYGDLYRPLMPTEGLQRVDGFGFGCVLLDMKVFDRIPQPWFVQTFWPDDHERAGQLKVGHDLNFCKKAREAGLEMWVDNTVDCGHLMNVMINKEYALTAYIEMLAEHKAKQRMAEQEDRRIVLAS